MACNGKSKIGTRDMAKKYVQKKTKRQVQKKPKKYVQKKKKS